MSLTVRRLLLAALVAGLASGLIATLLQAAKMWPLILAAETFERVGADHAGHDIWAPADGFERIAFTAIFNLLAGFGFALLVNGAIALRRATGGSTPDAATGALWGLAGFVCFALAPAFGLPPELPGMAAADLLDRQMWWAATAAATAGGLAALAFTSAWWTRAAGLALIVLPHVVGAPHPAEHGPVPAELAAQFVAASLVAAAAFWLTLGAVSGWMLRRPA